MGYDKLGVKVNSRMNKLILLIVSLATVGVLGLWSISRKEPEAPEVSKFLNENMISLPEPKLKSDVSLEEAIVKRRSQREFLDKPLSLEELSQLLWVAQGITDPQSGFRAAPSAGALYPLEIYVVVSKSGVENLDMGAYHYIPDGHKLELHVKEDVKEELFAASLSQEAVLQAPLSLVITADYERTTVKYGDRGTRYVWLEAGHAAQNIYLEATALGLGTVVLGAFDEEGVTRVLQLPLDNKPLYVMPVGYPE